MSGSKLPQSAHISYLLSKANSTLKQLYLTLNESSINYINLMPLKVSTRGFSWGKGGRCVWLTTYHPCSAETSRKSGALIYPEPLWPPRLVAGHLYFTFLYIIYCPYPFSHTGSYNKVRELATVCLPWQHWTKALEWFDDIDISAFHSCAVVDL